MWWSPDHLVVSGAFKEQRCHSAKIWWSPDHLVVSVLSRSSQRGPDESWIPFPPTSLSRSLQCLEIDMCHVFIMTVWQSVTHDWASGRLSYLHKVTKKVTNQNVRGSVWPYWYVCTVRWTLYIGILRYWLCDHAPSVAASLIFGLQTLGGGEDNKDVIRWCLMVTIIQTSWPLTPASQWWHSWLSSQPLSEWLECDLFIVDMILFVSEVSPSQWVTSTSVTGCVTAAF